MFFPGFSSPIHPTSLLPSSLAGGAASVQVARNELLGAISFDPAPSLAQANAVPRIHAFSNRRFSYRFAPPST
jgi:hypothetical protein